jgi:glucans biosynthesis protein
VRARIEHGTSAGGTHCHRRRRGWHLGWLGTPICIAVLLLRAGMTYGFGLDEVAARAEQLARVPYDASSGKAPQWLLDITYDQWRDIRFRPDKALWRAQGLPFQVQFFHPGLYYPRTVAVNVVAAGEVRHVASSSAEFDYGKNDFADRVPPDLGYAGFRIHYPLKSPTYHDEVIVFLGASYFRALGKNEVYGLSARGLAIDTVEPAGEEFPAFTEFWLVQPAPEATSLTLYALLDSASVTGAYQFVVTPGEQTLVAVDCRLFFRRAARKLGIAPLTSMFFHGENTTRWFDDFRPEVHDSDGLLLHLASGEWLWRPLDNPAALQVNQFQMSDPRGFGLIQRDRNYDHYQDLEARSELRPSAWVEPRGDWGAGAVELVELPTDSDILDNIVTYWVPAKPVEAGDRRAFSYRLSWFGADATRPPAGRVSATRRDSGTEKNAQRVVIDFAGGKLEALPANATVRGVISIAGGDDAGEIIDPHVVKNPVNGDWRLAFHVRPKRQGPLELRAYLARGTDVLTETWSYVLLP